MEFAGLPFVRRPMTFWSGTGGRAPLGLADGPASQAGHPRRLGDGQTASAGHQSFPVSGHDHIRAAGGGYM